MGITVRVVWICTLMAMRAVAEREIRPDCDRDPDQALCTRAGSEATLDARDQALTDPGSEGEHSLRQACLVASVPEPNADQDHLRHGPLGVTV